MNLINRLFKTSKMLPMRISSAKDSNENLSLASNEENNAIDWITVSLCIAFFLLMIIMELLMESLFHTYKNIDSIILSSLATLSQFFGCIIVPFITSSFHYNPPKTYKLFGSYVILTILFYLATGLATLSVTFVSYPTKIIFKSIKLVPTMIISSVMTVKIYYLKDYVSALLLTFGAICYSYSNSNNNTTNIENNKQFIGIIMLLLSVICDSIVPNLQKYLMTDTSVTPEDIMLNTNIIGFISLFIIMFLKNDFLNNNLIINFSLKLFFHLLFVGLCLGMAVNCYTNIIKRSGAVIAVIISTLRKIITIILSYIIFPKIILLQHIIGAISVIIGMIIESWKY